MANSPMQNYHTYTLGNRDIKKITDEICKETQFILGNKIWESKIYDNTKLATLIYEGILEGVEAVLKIQLIKLEIDEIDIIQKLNHINKSNIISIPKLLKFKYIGSNNEYGYTITEKILGDKIYNGIPDETQKNSFLTFFKDYRSNIVYSEFLESSLLEQIADINLLTRMNNRVSVANTKSFIDTDSINIIRQYFELIVRFRSCLRTDFLHGHLSYGDVISSNNRYFLLSIPFFGRKLLGYDAVYHIYNSFVYGNNQANLFEYFSLRYQDYHRLEVFDVDFELHYWFNVLERCVGFLILDNYLINNMNSALLLENKDKRYKLFNIVKDYIGQIDTQPL